MPIVKATAPVSGSRRSVWRSTRNQRRAPRSSPGASGRRRAAGEGRWSSGVSSSVQFRRHTGRATVSRSKNVAAGAARLASKPGTGPWISLREAPSLSRSDHRLGKQTQAATRRHAASSRARRQRSSCARREADSIGWCTSRSVTDPVVRSVTWRPATSSTSWCARRCATTASSSSRLARSPSGRVARTVARSVSSKRAFSRSSSARWSSTSSQAASSRRCSPIERRHGDPSTSESGELTSGRVTRAPSPVVSATTGTDGSQSGIGCSLSRDDPCTWSGPPTWPPTVRGRGRAGRSGLVVVGAAVGRWSHRPRCRGRAGTAPPPPRLVRDGGRPELATEDVVDRGLRRRAVHAAAILGVERRLHRRHSTRSWTRGRPDVRAPLAWGRLGLLRQPAAAGEAMPARHGPSVERSHLQQRARRAVSALGGGGYRTRVRWHLRGPSPSAVGGELSGAALLPTASPPRSRLSCPGRPVDGGAR